MLVFTLLTSQAARRAPVLARSPSRLAAPGILNHPLYRPRREVRGATPLFFASLIPGEPPRRSYGRFFPLLFLRNSSEWCN